VNVIITMAGRGSRFREAGFKKPKYEIEAGGKSLFEWSLRSLEPIFPLVTRIVFVTLKENGAENFIKSESSKIGLRTVRIVELDEVTDGQASTVLAAFSQCDHAAPVIIYNIDTHIDPTSWNYSMIPRAANGWLLCFHAPGTHWSFAKVGPDGWATEVAEKVRISELASVGLYYFDSIKSFVRAYRDTFETGLQVPAPRERYIAPMYNALINSDRKVAVSTVSLDSVIPLGTPSELAQFLEKQ
jgi:dTDP-glucose pyrophosphorylase